MLGNACSEWGVYRVQISVTKVWSNVICVTSGVGSTLLVLRGVRANVISVTRGVVQRY